MRTESVRNPADSAARRPLRPTFLRAFGILPVLTIAGVAFSPPALAANEPDLEPIDLVLYAQLLETHTRAVPDLVGTRVNYRSLKTSADWQRLAAQVRAAKPSRLARNDELAYWINAYNILTIDLILEHYPVESIREIGSFFSPVWDKTVATIEGREISLGFIEHEILRKLDEPRIHAAIVCASTSCPPLARTPFRSDTLDANLTAAMRAWLESPKKGISIDRANRRVRLSRIFDWFEEDFASRGGVLTVITAYVSSEDAEWLRTVGPSAQIRYFDYDWTLNDLE